MSKPRKDATASDNAEADRRSDELVAFQARFHTQLAALASAKGRAAGAAGGRSRAARMTPQQRAEAARAAARARWAAVRAAHDAKQVTQKV